MNSKFFSETLSGSSSEDEVVDQEEKSHCSSVPKKRKFVDNGNNVPTTYEGQSRNEGQSSPVKLPKKRKDYQAPSSNLSDEDSDATSTKPTVKTNIVNKNSEQPVYNNVAKNLMIKMGYKEGMGLGAKGQGRTQIIEMSKQRGRRGLGHEVKGFESTAALEWDPEMEKVSVEGDIEWLPECKLKPPNIIEMREWYKIGKKKLSIDDEIDFCDPNVLKQVLSCKSVFDQLEGEEMRKARTRSNPFETIRGVIFQNRAAMKMAEMDANFDFMFTNPKDENDEPIVKPNDLLYFADICAGPGGFSEYVLWRKKWHTKGFGLTLRSLNDFKLEEFFAGTPETFEPHYGVNGADGDGDIYRDDNLRAFRRHVLENTDNEQEPGVHFVMADGGFSVEGEENIQEILSKRLYLCQFLCALSILRTDGHFVCKLFDLFTPFSVGLIYLLYRAFKHICIYKPNTSRPANSERYVVCKWKRDNVKDIHDYMFEVNCNFGSLSPDKDIVEIVPTTILRENTEFYQYIVDSNNDLGERQVIGLQKIRAFVADVSLCELRQSDLRKECLEKWKVPDKMRSAKTRPEPAGKFTELLQDEPTTFMKSTPDTLNHANLKKIHSVYDYRCVVSGVGSVTSGGDNKPERYFLFGLGRHHVFKWTGKSWIKLDGLMLDLPAGTLIYCEIVTELKGEARAQKKINVIHIVDVMFIGGENMCNLHYTSRMMQAAKLVKAVSKPTKAQYVTIKVKEVYRFEELDRVFERLEMKSIKGNQNNYRLCYRTEDGRHFISSGIYIIKFTKEPWTVAKSKSKNCKYYYNIATKESVYDCPRNSVAPFSLTISSLLFWSWEPGVQLLDNQNAEAGKIHRTDMVHFIKSKTS